MKKQLFCISIILLVGLGVSAQTTEKAVEKIRNFYKDVSERARLAEVDAEHGQTGEIVMNELSINKRNHQWRAVGIYQQTYKFFYRGGDSEEHMYPDQLVMVKVERFFRCRRPAVLLSKGRKRQSCPWRTARLFRGHPSRPRCRGRKNA